MTIHLQKVNLPQLVHDTSKSECQQTLVLIKFFCLEYRLFKQAANTVFLPLLPHYLRCTPTNEQDDAREFITLIELATILYIAYVFLSYKYRVEQVAKETTFVAKAVEYTLYASWILTILQTIRATTTLLTTSTSIERCYMTDYLTVALFLPETTGLALILKYLCLYGDYQDAIQTYRAAPPTPAAYHCLKQREGIKFANKIDQHMLGNFKRIFPSFFQRLNASITREKASEPSSLNTTKLK